MFTPPPATTQEGSKNRPRAHKSKYDWRLTKRKGTQEGNAHNTTLYASSLPDGSLSSRGLSGGPTNRSFNPTLLQPMSASTGSLTPRMAMSMSSETIGALSRTTSVDSQFDEVQERALHSAFRISFQGDKRVRERPFRVVIGDVHFLLVDRVVLGHTDDVYQRSKKMWEHVPRGQAKVFVRSCPTPLCSFPSTPISAEATTDCPRPSASPSPSRSVGSFVSSYVPVTQLHGLRKFGICGDVYGSYNAPKKDDDAPTTVVAVEKMDGQIGQVAACQHEGVRYWLVGCRDRHILVQLHIPDEDVAAYVEEDSTASSSSSAGGSSPSRWTTALAKRTALCWRRALRERMSPSEVETLHQLMCDKQWSLCFDALLSGCEHLVEYNGNADQGRLGRKEDEAVTSPSPSSPSLLLEEDTPPLFSPAEGVGLPSSPPSPLESRESSAAGSFEEGELYFYAITFCGPSEKGLCVPVMEAMSVFRRFHLLCAPHSPSMGANSEEHDACKVAIHARLSSAGAVFFASSEEGLVVRLCMCPSHPHAMERAAQESIVTHRLHGSLLETKMRKKLGNLSKDIRAHTLVWERERLPFLTRFSSWLHSTRQLTPSTDLAALQELRNHWLTAQEAFRYAQEELQSFEDRSSNSTASVADGAGGEESLEDSMVSPPEVIVLVGPQGSGKSTLGRAMFALIEQSGGVPRWINQDELGTRRSYLATIHRAASEGRYTHLILDRMNLDNDGRIEYTEMGLRIVLVVAWIHPQGVEEMVNTCFERVKRRGLQHRTFRSPFESEDTKLEHADVQSANYVERQLRRMRGILRDSVTRYEVPTDDPALLQLDITYNFNAVIQRVWDRLSQRGAYDLPPLSKLNLENALHVAFEYEKLLQQYPHRITSVVLRACDLDDVRQHFAPEMIGSGGKRMAEPIEIVLHNFQDRPNPVMLVRSAALINKVVTVRLKAIVSDSKTALLHVHDDSIDESSKPTVFGGSGLRFATVAKGKKVSYKYCHSLLARVADDPEQDPYCVVEKLPPSSVALFKYSFVDGN